MRALQLTEIGSPPELRNISRPDPGPGQIGVRIAASALNFADLLMVRGTYQEKPKLPATLGLELAGTVDALGPGVDTPAAGSRVAIFSGGGGLAHYGIFDAARAVALPSGMPFREAAGFLISYGTSHLALTRRAALRSGESLVVTGAAGGVGLTAVEIGAQLGAQVIAVARGRDKLAAAEAAGAAHLLDSDTDDLRAAIKALGGADVVYDTVGGEAFGALIRACNPEARLLVIGFASGKVPEIAANHLLVKNLSVMGLYWGGYPRFAPGVLEASLTELFGWYDNGLLKPRIDEVLPLEEAGAGFERLARREVKGKIVITMDP